MPSRRRVASVMWKGRIVVVVQGPLLPLPRNGGGIWCALTACQRFLLTWDLTFSFSLEIILSVLGDEIESVVGVVLSGEEGGLEKDLDSAVSGGGSLLYVWSVCKRPSFTILSQLAEVPLVNLSALVPASLAAVMALSQHILLDYRQAAMLAQCHHRCERVRNKGAQVNERNLRKLGWDCERWAVSNTQYI